MARNFDDASTQYLEYGGAVVSAVPLTLACWFNSDSIAVRQDMLVVSRASNAHHFRLTLRGDAGDRVQAAAVNDVVNTTTSYSADTWHHAAAVFAADDDRTVYIDGGSSANDASSVTPASLDTTTIGCVANWGSHAQYMSGRIAEAAIWNAALTTAEIEVLAEGVSPLLVRPQSLVMYVPLIRDDDEDIVGGLSFTANGGPTVAAHCRVILPGVALHYAPAAAAGISIPVVMHHLRQQEVA